MSRGLYFYGKGTEHHQSWTRFLVHKRAISATKRVELVSNLILHVVLLGLLVCCLCCECECPSKDKSAEKKGSFCEEVLVHA
jgi:hypothetical protein